MSSQPFPGTVRNGDLNKFLKPGETPWPFPGSPSAGTLRQRAEQAGYKVS